MDHGLTSIDSHPCGKTGGVGVFFFPPTVENVHNVPHNFPSEDFAGARKSSGGRHITMNHSIKHSIKAINVALSVVLLLSPLSVPAHADFKYTDSTKMTGGSLYGIMKFAARFSKKGQNPLDPVVTSHYIKGGRLRTDNSDGTILIIDLEERRVTSINTLQKTYATPPSMKSRPRWSKPCSKCSSSCSSNRRRSPSLSPIRKMYRSTSRPSSTSLRPPAAA